MNEKTKEEIENLRLKNEEIIQVKLIASEPIEKPVIFSIMFLYFVIFMTLIQVFIFPDYDLIHNLAEAISGLIDEILGFFDKLIRFFYG